jgi:hypothetical protein
VLPPLLSCGFDFYPGIREACLGTQDLIRSVLHRSENTQDVMTSKPPPHLPRLRVLRSGIEVIHVPQGEESDGFLESTEVQ